MRCLHSIYRLRRLGHCSQSQGRNMVPWKWRRDSVPDSIWGTHRDQIWHGDKAESVQQTSIHVPLSLPLQSQNPAHAQPGLDVNATVCCSNTQYCVLNTTFSAQCCDIGSTCDLPCDSAHYVCPSLTTVSGVVSTAAACCPRSCPSVSQFKCASAYGGGCCPFGFACESGNSCRATVTATSSNAGVVSELPSGCTTSQIACPSSVGGGCCGDGQSCTVVDSTNYCASASSSAMRTGPDGILASGITEGSTPSGLSKEAKAGIGAGVVIGTCVVLGGLFWFCVVHRRRQMAARSQHESRAPALSQVSGSTAESRPSAGTKLVSGYFSPRAGPYSEENMSPISPGSPPGAVRGVPLSPHTPGDIAAPVEIDSRNHSNITSPGYMDGQLKGPFTAEYAIELP